MIRQLILSVAAIFGLTTMAMGQNVTLTINANPTINDCAVTFTGTNAEFPGWGVQAGSIQVVMIPSAGGLSRAFAAQNGTQPGQWTCTTARVPNNGYKAFAIATAAPVATTTTTTTATTGDDGGGGPQNPGDQPAPQLICSPQIDVSTVVFGPPGGPPPPAPPADDKPWFVVAYDGNSPARGAPVNNAASIKAKGTFAKTPDFLAAAEAETAILVQLPSGGGQFFRSPGVPNQASQQQGVYIWEVPEANTPQLPLNPKYNVYAYIRFQKIVNDMPTGEYQLICTPMQLR